MGLFSNFSKGNKFLEHVLTHYPFVETITLLMVLSMFALFLNAPVFTHVFLLP